MNNGELTLRVKPVQQRALGTMELILNTSATMLEEMGTDALTTNLIAQRAGIRVRNIYRYFKNKQAIIYELAMRMALKQSEFFKDFEYISDTDLAWEEALDKTVDSFFAFVEQQSGILVIRKAMKSSPELQAIDEQQNRELAGKLKMALQKRGIAVPAQKLDLLCIIIMDIATTLLDRAGMELASSQANEGANAVINELKTILKSYLSTYLGSQEVWAVTSDPGRKN